MLEFEFQWSLRETVVLKSPATIIGEEGIGGNECQREKLAGAYMFLKVKDKEDEEIEMSIMHWSEEVKKEIVRYKSDKVFREVGLAWP